MFESCTYESLLKDVLNNAPNGIDTRQGSIFYDAVAAIVMKIAKLYIDLDLVFSLVMLDTASGEYLDLKASEYGLTRKSATAACYYVTLEGTMPNVGERFYTNGVYFVLCQDENGVFYLRCETAGTEGNDVYSGTPAIPVSNIVGLTSATFGEIYIYGENEEEDDSLRTRVKEKLAGSTENGNKQHYKTWCENFDGVALARIFPLWNGPNTVKAILINSLGLPCSDAIVEGVQEYVDPATNGYTTTVEGVEYVVGDGLGEGAANIGAHFTAAAATSVSICVDFQAELMSGRTIEQALQEASTAFAEYFKELALSGTDKGETVVRITAIGAIIANLPSITDYSDLCLYTDDIKTENENIRLDANCVPVLNRVGIGDGILHYEDIPIAE